MGHGLCPWEHRHAQGSVLSWEATGRIKPSCPQIGAWGWLKNPGKNPAIHPVPCTHPWPQLLAVSHSSVQMGTDTTSAATCTKHGI